MIDVPKIMRDELGTRVIDLNTSTIDFEKKKLEALRKASEEAGCVLTNLKMNQRGLDLGSKDKATRDKSIQVYRTTIDAATILGVRWARPLPTKVKPDVKFYVGSYRILADYAQGKGVRMLVENYGWMDSDPESVSKLIEAIDRNLGASPDIGNWKDGIRYEALKNTFPLAVTCDFKFKALSADGKHAAYDLKKCFEIGWSAGFRGPWCFEHADADTARLIKDLSRMRGALKGWMKEAG